MRVLLWDYTGQGTAWMNEWTDMEKIEIVRTISPADQNQDQILGESHFDYLLIFEQGMRNIFQSLINAMKISMQQVIYALDMSSWVEHPAAIYYLLKNVGTPVHRCLCYNMERQYNEYVTCTTADGLNYIGTSKDNIIMPNMCIDRTTFATNQLNLFYEMSQRFYSTGDREGWFLDLGANIGTSGIYFVKKLDPNAKLLAFEPSSTNHMLLRINLMLNGLEETSIVEKLGLGAKASDEVLYYSPENPGNTGLLEPSDDRPSETIHIVALDDYIAEKNFPAADIKYIWLDTEGFEAQVLLGASRLLSEHDIPVFMEFNPQFWNKSGCYDKMMEFLEKCYPYFVYVREVQESGGKEMPLHPISDLWSVKSLEAPMGSTGDIFLVKRT